jgi:hypothetical protein
MRKLANHIALFCLQHDTGFLAKYSDPDLGLDKINSLHFMHVYNEHEMSDQIAPI